MLTKADIETSLEKLGNAPHFRKLCFRHPDIRVRAGYQAVFHQQATGEQPVFQQHPPLELLRSTPAGAKIPADESPVYATTCSQCGGGVCEPVKSADETEWLTEDAE